MNNHTANAQVKLDTDGSLKDLVTRLRDTPNWRKEAFGLSWKDMTTTFDRAPFAAADAIEKLLSSIAIAYGYLWHVNNDPDAPWQYSPERAAREARKILRDLITHEERGQGINNAREMIAAAPETVAERDRLKEINAELLAALERTLSWLTSYPGGGTMGPSGPYEQARAAIAKATGQSLQDLADIGQELNI